MYNHLADAIAGACCATQVSDRDRTILQLNGLVETQNNTIAILARELGFLRSASATTSGASTAERGDPLAIATPELISHIKDACTMDVLSKVRPLLSDTWEDTKSLV